MHSCDEGPLQPRWPDFRIAGAICSLTAARSSSRKYGPEASRPESNGFLLLQRKGVFSRVLTNPPALSTNAAPAATSHSFLGVRVKVTSASPVETSASL